ncbi:MAG: guanylate kinase [Pseudomonadales bacterium]|nr:guanylate kinase [Pseudomonadales bacterium]
MGRLYIVSAPSGAGKSSLLNALIEQVPDVKISVSTTTRAKRAGEEEGLHYHFETVKQFEVKIKQDEFYEYAKVFDNYYGTSKTWVAQQLESGVDVILEIDWQGAQQMRQIRDDIITIFIVPPSIEALHNRLVGRGQDSDEIIAKRMSEATSEISHYDEYDYVVINDEFDHAVNMIKSIFQANRLTLEAQQKNNKVLFDDLLK